MKSTPHKIAGPIVLFFVVFVVWRKSRPGWDHDHCEFCGDKFGFSGTLTEGWTTVDEYRWICDPCFNDFRERFRWHTLDE